MWWICGSLRFLSPNENMSLESHQSAGRSERAGGFRMDEARNEERLLDRAQFLQLR